MSLASLLADTVDVLDYTETTEDDFGNTLGTWDVTTAARPARVRATNASDLEDRVGQEVTGRTRICYLNPADGTINDRQRLRWDGQDWYIVSIHPTFGRSALHHYRLLIEEAH